MKKLVTLAAALAASLALVPTAFGAVCQDCEGGGGGGGGGGGTPNSAPTAAFSSSGGTIYTADNVSFTNNSSDSDGSIASYQWSCGDGASSTAANPAHAYANGGTYDVTLTVTDNLGATGSVTHQVTIHNRAPDASFTFAPAVPQIGEAISFTGSASDPEGHVAWIDWNFGDGRHSNQLNPQISFDTPGDHAVTLWVTDDQGSWDFVTQNVHVNAPPTAAIQIGSGSGLSVNVTADAADAEGAIADYAWEFGDGVQGSGPAAAHTYAAGGSYTIKLTVTDANGATASDQIVVNVTAPPAGNDGGDNAGGGSNTGSGSGTQNTATGGAGGSTTGDSTTGGSGTPGNPAAIGGQGDTAAPVITVPAKVKAKQKAGKVKIAIASNEPVNVVARLTGKVKGNAKAKVNGKGSIVIKLSSKAKKALKAAKVVKLTLKLVATDAAGNTTTKTIRVSLV
jgi:PKD repeat protein